MTAAANERDTDFAGLYPARGTFGVNANTLIKKGWMACLDVDGLLVNADTIANGTLFAVGKCSATYDNRTGSPAGGLDNSIPDAEVEYGIFAWEAADIGVDDVGKVAYIVDNQTVSISSNSAARGPAGIITEWRDGKAWVLMGPQTRNLTVA